MGVPTPKEFEKSHLVSLGLIIWVAAISFSMGMIYKSIVDHTDMISKAREFTQQEVDGLRADWERDRVMQNERLKQLEQ